MSPSGSNAGERITQAVFCVCTDDAVSATAAEAAAEASGGVFLGEFRDYITAEKRPQFSPLLKNASSCVAIVDFDKEPELGLQTAERLQQIFAQRISIIGVGTSIDASLLLRAMRAGCVEFFSRPVKRAEITAALHRFQKNAAAGLQTQGASGRVLSMFGAKGGVGTTTLAVHLATFLVQQHNKRILLIDHKQQLGHVALYLGLKDTQYHFTELLRSADRLDRKLLEGFVLKHKSGLEVIASPENAMLHSGSKRGDLERVMDFLRTEYDYVLVDSVVGYEDAQLSLLDQADEIYLVSTPDVAALRDLARLVENLSLGDEGMKKLRLVINRATADDSISSQQIQKAVRFPVSLSIANSYFEVMRAINAGEPIKPEGKSLFSQQVAGWAHRIAVGEALEVRPAVKKGRIPFWRPLVMEAEHG